MDRATISDIKKDAYSRISDALGVNETDAENIFTKAHKGGEFVDYDKVNEWLDGRLIPNTVTIDEEGYAKMCIDALKILKSTAATDYGSSRQRDLGQLWGDMTRGYLAEYAFVKYLKDIWGVKAELGHEKGVLEDYLPSDIHKICKKGERSMRDPKIKIGIKGTKWSGIWFDIPGAQFNHSDIHVLVKVGVTRDHLFAYFKHISVFKDKILKKGMEVGSLKKEEADDLFNNLPWFSEIPAYVAGFVLGGKKYGELPYGGRFGRKNYTITSWNGEMKSGDLHRIREKEELPRSAKISFEGIGQFSHDSGYLFNTGSLLWRKKDWKKYVIDKL